MKTQTLLCYIILVNQLSFAQLPKGPNGETLYQKGDCKTILPNVKYKCVFCEDEALTKNCKEYDCSLTECTESKPAKGLDGKLLSKPISIEGKLIKIRRNEDSSKSLMKAIDVTEYIKSKKITNGTVVIYESEDKYKIYATYKKGKLTEWYAMGEDGKKIQSSPVGITPTTCDDCMILPNGTTVCKKCTITTEAALPAKKAD